MKKITIHPVSRIEGHAKITIHLDDEGQVSGTQFHVTQIRGFEKFTEGRPYYEMPSITARICGICPVSHLLASVKACDAIMAVRIPAGGGEAAGAPPLRAVRAVARALLLPPLRPRPPPGDGLRPREAQRGRPPRGAPRRPARRHRAPQVRPAGHRAPREGARPPVVDGAGRRQRPARPARAREDARRAARGAGDRPPDDRAVEEDARPVPERDLHLQQLPDHVRRPRGPRRVAAPLRRQPPLRRPRGPDGGRPGAPGGLRRRTSARRRWPTRT